MIFYISRVPNVGTHHLEHQIMYPKESEHCSENKCSERKFRSKYKFQVSNQMLLAVDLRTYRKDRSKANYY